MFTSRHSPGALAAPALVLVGLFLSGCGGAERDLKSCSADADCGAGARCVQATCVADRPPAVSFSLPASATTNRLVTVTATATDPDTGDSVASFTWTVAATSGGCEADAEAGVAGQAELVFWCAGTYEVSVAATDGLGLGSAPQRRTIEVSQVDGAPVVSAAAAIDVAHRCLGTPLRCRLDPGSGDARVPLSASATSPVGGTLTYEWKALPPPGADPSAAITYSPGATSPDTAAWIETPGGPIAGEWRFRFRATGADGLIGQAILPVRVGNRPPELQLVPFQVEHRFHAGHYLASGTLVPQLVDPDGDALTVSASWQDSGAAGCSTQLVTSDPLAANLSIDCVDPRQLIGLASRGVQYRAVDANGGSVEGLVPVEVTNRPPVVQLVGRPGSASLQIDHSYGPCPDGAGSCYLATGGAPFELVDPDGDPVGALVVESHVESSRTSSVGEVATSAGVASFRFATRSGFPGEFRAGDDSTGFSLLASGADALGAPASLAVEVRVGNRPPIIAVRRSAVQAVHTFDPNVKAYLADATLSSFDDPDGDPLDPVLSTGDAACPKVVLVGLDAQVHCRLDFPNFAGRPPLASFAASHALTATVSDGWEQVSAPATVAIQNGAPTARPFDGTVESCKCTCKVGPTGDCLGTPAWTENTSTMPLPVDAGEPDGDPVQVVVTPTNAVSSPVKTVLVGGAMATLVGPALPASYTVTVDDGLTVASTTSRVTGVTCSKAGTSCDL